MSRDMDFCAGCYQEFPYDDLSCCHDCVNYGSYCEKCITDHYHEWYVCHCFCESDCEPHYECERCDDCLGCPTCGYPF